MAQRNTHLAFDADKDGFTDLPQLTKYNFNPRLFYQFNEKTKGYIGGTFTNEVRSGGDLKILDGELPSANNFYSERNDINRSTTQLKLEHQLSDNQRIEIRNSFNFFSRELTVTPSLATGRHRFAGNQVSSFSELAYSQRKEKNVFIVGLNFYSDDFKERSLQGATPRTENYKTLGAFANYVFDIGKKVSIESGLRSDYVFDEKMYVLPRVSALFKWTEKMTTRIGGGMGYRNASMFNQEAEILAYQNVLSINRTTTKGEQSFGGNVDFGYKTPLGDNFFLIFNQMFFYSKIDKPLILNKVGNNYEFGNANGYTASRGAETFFKLGFYDFVWFVGYTFTDANNHFSNQESVMTLTPRHSLKGDILYALPGKWRIGFDYEYKSGQTLSSGKITRSYWTSGGLVEYTHKSTTIYANTENFGNVRQTNFESLKSAPYNTPQFTEVWAPLDGFVFNAGIKIRL